MRLLPSTLAPLVFLACGCGVPAYDFSSVDASQPGVEASHEAGHRLDAGTPHDAGSKKDGGETSKETGVDAGCVKGAIEDCTNGMDDNCDGLVDCADPECSGDGGAYSCTALPTEMGWSLVAFQQG